MSDTGRQAFEKPDMRARAGELNMPEALSSHAGQGDFDAALVTNDASMFHSLVLAAQALPIDYGSENTSAEQSIALGFEGPVIDGLGFGHFAMRPAPDLFGRGQRNADGIEICD